MANSQSAEPSSLQGSISSNQWKQIMSESGNPIPQSSNGDGSFFADAENGVKNFFGDAEAGVSKAFGVATSTAQVMLYIGLALVALLIIRSLR